MINELSNIVQAIVAQMDCTIQGEYNDIDLRTETCKTKWARVGKTVMDSNDVIFKITDLESDEYIIAETEPLTDPVTDLNGLIKLNAPLFIHGTKKATNLEWTKISNNVTFKTPIIWLLGSLNFKQFGRESTIDIESALRIFFLDETDIVNYYTADHISNVVYPMEQLVKEFIDTINRDRKFKTVESWEIIEFSRFGVEQENGMFQNILDANLSGVELRITLTKYKENCKC
jgi:hypothetical protein